MHQRDCDVPTIDLEGFYALLTYFLLSPELVSNEETRDAVIFILTKETSRIHTRLAVYVPSLPPHSIWPIELPIEAR